MPNENPSAVYEILDHTASGIRLQVQFQRRINASLIACGLPFIRAVSAWNESGGDLPAIEFSVELSVGNETAQRITWREESMPAGGSVRFDGREHFTEFDSSINGRHEPAIAALTVAARPVREAEVSEKKAETPETETALTTAVEIGVCAEFLKLPGAWQSIAVFVQPASQAVTKILQAVSEFVLQRTGSGTLDGYAGGLARAKLIAEAIYQTIRDENIVCAGSPAAFEAMGQKMRTPGKVLGERFGDDIELSVTYAACCEAAGLYPIIIVTTSRAFPAFIAVSELEFSLALGSGEGFGFLEETVVDDGEVIAGLVEKKAIVPVHLGGMGSGKRPLSFRSATKKAGDYVRSLSNELRAAIIVSQCRRMGILPLPGFLPEEERPLPTDEAPATEDSSAPQKETGASASEQSAAAETSSAGEALDPADEVSSEHLEPDYKDDVPDNIRLWKQALFDFSLRNPLLNIQRSTHALDLTATGGTLGRIAEALYKGRKPRFGSVEESIGTPENKADGVAAVFSILDHKQHVTRLRVLRRAAEALEEETGSHHLYLSLGVLVHPKSSASNREVRSPLFLLPVKLGGGREGRHYELSIVGDDVPQPNLCLLEWLRLTRNLTFDTLANSGLDGSAGALGAAFEKIRISLLAARLPWRVEETTTLAILECATFRMWKDLDRNWPIFMENPVVRHLIERPGKAFDQPSAAEAFAEEKLVLPLPADGSQMTAVEAALNGESFVLEGAPGTGKSQTIANLIVQAMEAGKRILFVSGKEAALESVGQHLESVGFKDFTLEAHGSRISMQDIRQQLRRSTRAQANSNEFAWKPVFARYADAIAPLRDYAERLHMHNTAGLSLYSAYDALVQLGEGPDWELDPRSIGKLDIEAISKALSDVIHISQQIGEPEHDSWLLVGLDSVENLTFTTLTRTLDELNAVRKRIKKLNPNRGWPDAFRELKPDKPLRVLNECIAASQAGLLPSKAYFRDIDRAGWRNAVAALREKLEFFLHTNHEALSMLAPGLIDSPMLNDWTIQATGLADAMVFAELRRKSIRSAIESLVRKDIDLGGPNLLAVLRSAQNIRGQAAELRTHAIAIVGLVLPANWGAHRPRALEELDAAVRLSQNAVWLEHNAPVAWLKVLEPKGIEEIETLRDVETAWAHWLSITGATEHSIRQWMGGRTWLEAWDEAAPHWEDDLAGSGLLQLQRHAWLRKALQAIEQAGGGDFADKLAHRSFPMEEADTVLRRGLASASLRERLAACGLDQFDAAAQEQALSAFQESLREARKLAIQAGPSRLLARRPFRANSILGEVTALVRQIERKRNGMSLREISARYPEALLTFAPTFLMSPGAVAHFLDAGALKFDMVIFDEASRIRTAEAICAMGRARTVVIAGDPKQLPPGFIAETGLQKHPVHDEEPESLLSAALNAGLPKLRLAWHYRSENEELIAFSNTRYYDGELSTLPAPCREKARLGILWRRLNGKTGQAEARAVVDEILARLRDPERRDESLGVVCLDTAQRDLILDILEDSPEPLIQSALVAPAERRLFVKTLETVQGEERDIILFSLALVPDPITKTLSPDKVLCSAGGSRLLNVGLTRARRQIMLWTSFGPEHIASGAPEGLKDLKSYLEYAAELAKAAPRGKESEEHSDAFATEIAGILSSRGYIVQTGAGRSAFRIDLAVKKRDDDGWRLAIMLDGPDWRARPTVTDRDYAPRLLRDSMNWPAVARVWLPGWLRDKTGQVARLVDLIETS